MQLSDDVILNLIASACGTSLARITLFEGLEDLGVELSPTRLSPDALRSARSILAAVHEAL